MDSSIKFVGSNFGKYIYKYFLKADILVIPGAVGLSIVHAFSYGLPIITSDNMKIHGPEIELLTVGDNGDLFESENANSLACKIIKWKNLLSNNSNLKYSKNCINNIYDKGYLPNIVASKIYNGLYK